MDEDSRIIYLVVSFAEAPTCPRLHPHLGSSGPVKHKHRESGIWEGNESRATLDELTDLITSVYTASPRAFSLMIEEDAPSSTF